MRDNNAQRAHKGEGRTKKNGLRRGCKDTTRKHKGDMQAISKHANTWETKKKTMSRHTDELETNTTMHALRHAYSWASQKTKSPRQRAKVT